MRTLERSLLGVLERHVLPQGNRLLGFEVAPLPLTMVILDLCVDFLVHGKVISIGCRMLTIAAAQLFIFGGVNVSHVHCQPGGLVKPHGLLEAAELADVCALSRMSF